VALLVALLPPVTALELPPEALTPPLLTPPVTVEELPAEAVVPPLLLAPTVVPPLLVAPPEDATLPPVPVAPPVSAVLVVRLAPPVATERSVTVMPPGPDVLPVPAVPPLVAGRPPVAMPPAAVVPPVPVDPLAPPVPMVPLPPLVPPRAASPTPPVPGRLASGFKVGVAESGWVARPTSPLSERGPSPIEAASDPCPPSTSEARLQYPATQVYWLGQWFEVVQGILLLSRLRRQATGPKQTRQTTIAFRTRVLIRNLHAEEFQPGRAL
jgi:hypothetical protein